MSRGEKRRENKKCLRWFLLVQKLNEIKFIPGLFFSSNFPKDPLQYVTLVSGGFLFVFVSYTEEECHLKLEVLCCFQVKSCNLIFVVFKIRLMRLRQAGFVDKDVAAVK